MTLDTRAPQIFRIRAEQTKESPLVGRAVLCTPSRAAPTGVVALPENAGDALFLAGARVGDLHGFLFLAATGFVPLQTHMVLSGTLITSRTGVFIPGIISISLVISECLGRGIVGALGKLNAGAHVVDPRANEFFLHVVVAFDAHAFELHILHFAVFTRHLHFAGHIHHQRSGRPWRSFEWRCLWIPAVWRSGRGSSTF